MKETFVSYEQAAKLRECGFDLQCIHANPDCSAITLWQAQKWMREKCGIHINVCIYSDYFAPDADRKTCDKRNFWGFDIYAVPGGRLLIDNGDQYDTYEEALSAGIDAAIELIEKKGE